MGQRWKGLKRLSYSNTIIDMNTTKSKKPIVENEAYYSRVMSPEVIVRIKNEFAWILEYVERHPELDYQTGSNAVDSWFSLYRGTGRLFTIKKDKVLAHPEYERLCKEFYNHPSPETLDCLLSKVTSIEKFGRYYISKGKKKEGYYQNLISRRYSLFCKESDDFIIIDKEYVLGYKDKETRNIWTDRVKENYRGIVEELQKTDGFPIEIKLPGTECDFVGLSKDGDVLLFELKRHEDTAKIYLSPLQIGMYDDLTKQYVSKFPKEWESAILSMAEQKVDLGILKPKWPLPKHLSGKVRLAVVVGGDASRTAKKNFSIVRSKVNKDIKYYSCKEDGELFEIVLP